MKRVLLALLVLLLLLVGVLVVRTLRFSSRQVPAEPAEPFPVDATGAAGRLAEALRHRTIAASDGMGTEDAAFRALHAQLVAQFPRVHARSGTRPWARTRTSTRGRARRQEAAATADRCRTARAGDYTLSGAATPVARAHRRPPWACDVVARKRDMRVLSSGSCQRSHPAQN